MRNNLREAYALWQSFSTRAYASCGNNVTSMWMNGRKKCAQLSTDCYHFLTHSVRTWTNSCFTNWFSIGSSPILSTLKFARSTTVNYKVIPIVHSTYYYDNQFYRKDY